MSFLSILGEIVLVIGGAITGNVSSQLNSMSRDKRFSDEDREKCSNASEGFAEYSDAMRSKANEFKEQRQNENN